MDDLSPFLFAGRAERSSSICRTAPLPLVGSAVTVSRTGVAHGRGLAASRDVAPGECLFVVGPAASARVGEVRRRWEKEWKKVESLEIVAEEVLLEDMRRCLESDEEGGRAQARAFLALLGDDGGEEEEKEEDDCGNDSVNGLNGKEMMEVLLGRGVERPEGKIDVVDDAALLGIVRRNAFGPEFRQYASMEREWTSQDECGDRPIVFNRILGVYPLAAIVNHSCEPNAVRVFAGETMLVHASVPIKKGEEIVWSYIPSTQTYTKRQEQIEGKFGFQCRCGRCRNEGSVLAAAEDLTERLAGLDKLNEANPAGMDAAGTADDFASGVLALEEVLVDKRLSNETRRYLRVSYTNLFINYFNATLTDLGRTCPPDANTTREMILAQAIQLHFAFASCHNASTEHLSILHLCYELIGTIHSATGNDQSKTIAKVRFWTEQLKRAHMIRYGKMGNDLEHVREAMRHSRLVLRNLDGLRQARWDFI